MLVARVNQALGGFLLIIQPPPLLVEPFDYSGIFAGRVAPDLFTLEIVVAERTTRISPAVLTPVSNKAYVFCECLEPW